MNTPRQELEARVADAVGKLFSPAPPAPYVRPCLDSRHGDFQTNAALVYGKQTKANPVELARQLADIIDLKDVAEKPEIAGPGFLNFRLKPDYLARQIAQLRGDDRLGVPVAAAPETLVIDYSGPNIAKEMHVGHLRSTILGDALARIYSFIGHRVIADNHLGDWGTGFGMILLGYKREGDPDLLKQDPFGHLETLYRKVQEEAKADENVREAAKRELVLLQSGDAKNRELWEQFRKYSLDALDVIYQRLGVQFDHTLGESFYNDMLANVVTDLVQRSIARESEGAVAIFSEGKLPPKDDPFLVSDNGAFRDNPLLVRKSDGGFNYATTDLATIRYRHEHFHAQRVIYVVDGRQQMHFRQLFDAARRWGYGDIKLEHVWFGAILGPDKKPMKTKEGENVKLKALLDEAEERAAKIIADKMDALQARIEEKTGGEKRLELAEHQRAALARVVGLGALKYADLAQNRNLDYVFSWDKLLAFDGNTAPYVQNAYVRIRAIFRKAGLEHAPDAAVNLTEPAELALGRKLLDFADSLFLAAEEYRPHYLCLYLFELATLFHKFYESCPVLSASDGVRDSRLVLCDLTARTLSRGLNLLGIGVVEQM
ncbi:MAG: arginine--tRNA ligase [Methylacidiphilales bacterium]|nr:arginine--tRNA ligase [Candidatus Methylacidiphilales bacterium]